MSGCNNYPDNAVLFTDLLRTQGGQPVRAEGGGKDYPLHITLAVTIMHVLSPATFDSLAQVPAAQVAWRVNPKPNPKPRCHEKIAVGSGSAVTVTFQ